MYRGRYRVGDELYLGVLCVNAVGAPAAPTEAPTADIWTAGVRTKAVLLPAVDRPAVVGLFAQRLFLGQDFAPGRYEIHYRYRAAGFPNVVTDTFEIAPGGDAAGSVVSMAGYKRPQATYVVHQLDSGRIRKGKNPRI